MLLYSGNVREEDVTLSKKFTYQADIDINRKAYLQDAEVKEEHK